VSRARHSNCLLDTKRKSGQAALDSSSSIDSPDSSPRKLRDKFNGRPVKPMPKRARLQPTTTGPAAQSPPAPIAPRFANREVERSSSSFPFSSYSSSPSSLTPSASTSAASAANRSSVFTHDSPTVYTRTRARVARDRYATSSIGDSDESDGNRDVDDSIPRYRTRSQTTDPAMTTFLRLMRRVSTSTAT